MSAKAIVWVIEVMVQGAWKPTSAVTLSRRLGRALANEMNADDDFTSYRLSPYERTEAK